MIKHEYARGLKLLFRSKGTEFTLLIVILLLVLGFSTSAQSHEPVFSLGPETIYKGGTGIESEFEIERGNDERHTALNYEILYGLTEDLSFTIKVPQIIDHKEGDERDSGLGDIQLRGKYQLFRQDTLGAQDKISVILGIKLPTGDEDTEPPLGTGTTDFLFGMSYGHESRTWYHFITLRYLLRTQDDGFEPGDRFFYDASIGYRPWLREYLEWDFVALLEMSGEYEFESKLKGHALSDSGGNTIWLGPTGLLSYRNIMLKGGIQFPAYQNLKGNQERDDFRAIFAIEFHF